jgi:hypothetical protein
MPVGGAEGLSGDLAGAGASAVGSVGRLGTETECRVVWSGGWCVGGAANGSSLPQLDVGEMPPSRPLVAPRRPAAIRKMLIL